MKKVKLLKTARNALFLWTAAGMISWSLPNYGNSVSNFHATWIRPTLCRYWIKPLGIWQNWNMYIEYSSRWTERTWKVLAETTDGKTVDLNYPKMQNLSRWDAYLSHRYRKFVETASNSMFFFNELTPNVCEVFERTASKQNINAVKISLFLETAHIGGPPAYSRETRIREIRRCL